MGTRGRKSAAELAVIGAAGVVRTRLADPPAHLGEEARKLWREVVNGLPADWFNAGSLVILGTFCALSVSLRRTLGLLERLETETEDFDADSWRATQRQAAELGQRITMLATRLRLTPQSHMQPVTAGRRVRDARPLSVYDEMVANGET